MQSQDYCAIIVQSKDLRLAQENLRMVQIRTINHKSHIPCIARMIVKSMECFKLIPLKEQ